MCVAIGGENFKDTIVNRQKSNIEGTTAEVEHQDILFTVLLVKAIGNCSCCPA